MRRIANALALALVMTSMASAQAVGALGGVVFPADRWEEVPKPVRVGLIPARGQARLAFSFSFR